MGNGWVGPYTPVYVQPSGGRERWWIRKQQKTSCHGKAESLRMTGKTLRKFNTYRPPEKSPGHKNGKDRVPSIIFSATRFVHFLRLCMLELYPPHPVTRIISFLGNPCPKKNPTKHLWHTCDCCPGYREENPLLGAQSSCVSEASWVEGCSAMMLEITSCKVGDVRWSDGAMVREVPYCIKS